MASGDFDTLSNDQLREELLSRGQNVGPVMETTRKLYLNKLKRLAGVLPVETENEDNGVPEEPSEKMINGAQINGGNVVQELDSLEESNEKVSHEISETATTRQPGMKTSSSLPASPKRVENDESLYDDGYYGEESSRYLSSDDPKYMSAQFNLSDRKTPLPINSSRQRASWILRLIIGAIAICGIIYFLNSKYPNIREPEEEL